MIFNQVTMSNFYIFPEDWTHWLANDRWDIYLYERMENGYSVETLFENEFREIYPLPWDKPVEGAKTTRLKNVK